MSKSSTYVQRTFYLNALSFYHPEAICRLTGHYYMWESQLLSPLLGNSSSFWPSCFTLFSTEIAFLIGTYFVVQSRVTFPPNFT